MALTNEQYDIIRKEYDLRLLAAADKARARAEEAARIPGYSALEERASALIRSFAQGLAQGAGAVSCREELQRLRQEKEQLLQGAGYPADYLEDVYECPLCRDTGYVDGHKCTCFRKREIDLLYADSHLGFLTDRIRFSSLREDVYLKGGTESDVQHFIKARDASLSFVENFPACRNLLFTGSVGTGKTVLSVCIAGELIDRGFRVIYFSAVSLFERLSAERFGSREEQEEQRLSSDLYSCDLLVIDDLGTELTNSFVAEQLFALLNERSIRQNRTVISTNLDLEQLFTLYAERIFSRITSEFDIFRLTGPDIRRLTAG